MGSKKKKVVNRMGSLCVEWGRGGGRRAKYNNTIAEMPNKCNISSVGREEKWWEGETNFEQPSGSFYCQAVLDERIESNLHKLQALPL